MDASAVSQRLSTLCGWLTAILARLHKHRPGMAMRMALGFTALALTIVTANLVTQEGTRMAREQMRALAAKQEPLVRAAETVAGAIAAYQRLIVTQSQSGALPGTEVQDASRHMLEAAQEYARLAGIAGSTPLERLTPDLERYRELGDQLLKSAGVRRQRAREYAARYETLDTRLNAPQAQATRFAGAVFASEALLNLGRAFTEVRDAMNPATPSSADKVAATERAFIAMLEKYHENLAKAQGAAWIEAVRKDFARLVAARRSVFASLADLRTSSGAFLDHGARMSTMALTQLVQPARRALAEANDVAMRTAEQSDRQLVWTSVIVLALLLAISIATVMSVTLPVHRLTEATRKLASGAVRTRVPRGGVRELDSLAEAFNQMAEQLESAEIAVRTQQAQLEAKVEERTRELQHLADHDPLTQLPNRRQLLVRLDAALARIGEGRSRVAVLFIDLDNFKTINDSVGHAFGDRVLQAVSERLHQNVLPANAFSARWGGDEFIVVCEDIADLAAVETLSASLLDAFQGPLSIHGRELRLSVSIGASVYPDHAADSHALLRAADAALFRAKELGRNRASLFMPELLQAASSRFRTEQSLRRAIERNEFELLYQPEVCFERMEMQLTEALLRWHPGGGEVVTPAEFLDVAERTGLILDISDWVLRTAVQTAAHWQAGAWPQTKIAINVSAQQLLGGNFAKRVEALLHQHGLPARCLEIELTENVLQTGPATIQGLHELKELGISLALDDFGTGYSSLTSLERLPLNRVKIDRSLIATIDSGSRSFAIVRSIVGLCHSLGLQVTVEGVERGEQLGMLLADRGVQIQGFLVSRPMPAPRIPAYIEGVREHLQALLLSCPQPERDLDASGIRALRTLRAGMKRKVESG